MDDFILTGRDAKLFEAHLNAGCRKAACKKILDMYTSSNGRAIPKALVLKALRELYKQLKDESNKKNNKVTLRKIQKLSDKLDVVALDSSDANAEAVADTSDVLSTLNLIAERESGDEEDQAEDSSEALDFRLVTGPSLSSSSAAASLSSSTKGQRRVPGVDVLTLPEIPNGNLSSDDDSNGGVNDAQEMTQKSKKTKNDKKRDVRV